MTPRPRVTVALAACISIAVSGIAVASSDLPRVDAAAPLPSPLRADQMSPVAAMARMPVTFIPAHGGREGSGGFTGFVPAAQVRLERGAVTYDLFRRAPGGARDGAPGDGIGTLPHLESLRVRATFPGSLPAPTLTGEDPLAQRTQLYLGNDPSRWRTDVVSFGAVRMRGLYPGIDLAYHGTGRALEYDFHVAPGADPARIRVHYDGVEKLAVSRDGALEVTTRFGRMSEAAPVAWQSVDGARRPVRARYRCIDDHTFAFAIDGPWDHAQALVIDPILQYSTFLGGSTYDEVHDIVVDQTGAAYIVGGTMSPDFPATGTPVPSTDYSVYVAKFNPSGSALVYNVFLGGSATQIGYGMVIDAAKNVTLSGITTSSDFPITAGAYSSVFQGNTASSDMFVAKLSPTGTLVYGTYLGGTSSDWGGRMALDSQGRVWVAAVSSSNDYPVTAGAYDVSFNGGNECVVSGLNLAGGGASDLVYSTYLGGSLDDECYDIVADNADDLYLAGSTRSNNFPATGGPPFNGTFDAFVAKLRPLGAGAADLVFATKFGGSAQDYGGSVAVEGSGSFYFTGSTASSNFPTTGGAFQTTYGGGTYDGFLIHLAYDGSTVLYETLLGSANEDRCGDVVLDPGWNPVVIGTTMSPGFPTTTGAFDLTFNGDRDVFMSRFDVGGTLLESTFIGGTYMDVPYALAIDSGSRRYLAGNTQCFDFPTTPAAYDTSLNGGPIDVFVMKFSTVGPDTCEQCASPADTCCAQAPSLAGIEHPFLSPNVLVGTRQPAMGWPYCVTIFDLGSAPPVPLEDTNWAAITRYNGPGNSWNADSLGTVFGLTLDEYGNIFVTHTSCYAQDLIAKVFGAAPGAIYRIDGGTGKITTFAVLPNFPDGALPPGENFPGLGNISYDCRHKQFFVTDLENGKLYRITPNGINGTTGTVQQGFDPLTPDNGAPGFAPIGQRLWGVQWHGDRVYYSVWADDMSFSFATVQNEIRSVGLNSGGAILPGTDRHELWLPDYAGTKWSMPISDISFSASGKMLLGERGIIGDTYPQAHVARALEYACVAGCWLPANLYAVGQESPDNCAGGVDYDRDAFAGVLGRVWVSGDAIHHGVPPHLDVVYGYQGFRPIGGSILNSIILDSDGNIAGGDKTSIGDIEAPGCPDSTVGTICGKKFHDLNHDGIQNGGEPVLAGWTIVLNGPGGTQTATTDAQGNYCFYNRVPGTYTIGEVGQPGWIQTAPAGGTYTVVLAGGQIVTGKTFGNYFTGPPSGCVTPPPGMVAWWPFREIPGSGTTADVTHLTPSRNVLQLFGGAAITAGQKVGNGLCAGPELQFAKLPYANQAGLNFNTGPMAIDAWVNPAPGGGGSPRMIVEKRVLISPSPYKTRGWALYLNGQQCFLELGIGISTQIVPGPTLPAGVWSHLAVSVGRTPAEGRWYLNGALVPSFNFVPTPGGTQSNADLYVGQVSPPFGFGPGLQGCIDELEIFDTPLTAQSALALYTAGVAGKCPEYCRVPQVTTICKDKTSVTVCMDICNTTAGQQAYHWSLAGLPPGPGCTFNGPTVFTPASGAITVPANGCASICVTIPRPAGFTTTGATACFQFTFVNDTTNASGACQGAIRADNTCWCITPVQTDIVPIPARMAPGLVGVPIDIGIGHPCDPVALPYRIVAQYTGGDHPDPLEVSLNGLPPGEPVTGQFTPGPGGPGGPGGDEILTVHVSMPNGYDPAALYEIVFEADTDDDGVLEPVCGTRIASSPDSIGTTDVPEGPRVADSSRLLASPNPFFGGSTIAFSLAVPTDVALGVYDVGGRLVRMLQNGRLVAGAHRLTWDGRDAAGHRAPAGVYFARLASNRLHLEAKVVKLR